MSGSNVGLRNENKLLNALKPAHIQVCMCVFCVHVTLEMTPGQMTGPWSGPSGGFVDFM